MLNVTNRNSAIIRPICIYTKCAGTKYIVMVDNVGYTTNSPDINLYSNKTSDLNINI